MVKYDTKLSDYDLFLELEAFSEGRSCHAWRCFGSHPGQKDGQDGYVFRVWAPNAKQVCVFGDFNGWDENANPLEKLEGGIWQGFVAGLKRFDTYKYAVHGADGKVVAKADPYAFHAETRPGNASKIYDLEEYPWGDQGWLDHRAKNAPYRRPMNIYECHLGSWRRTGEGEFLSYRDTAQYLVPYVKEMGYTHVELLPVMEHPLDASWGYQVTGYYAVDSRLGFPDDFRYLVDQFHQAGIGVIMDWVPAHFPKDAFALGRFDGTPLYEDPDPLRGEHPEWGTYVFNFGRREVRNFLVANALFWLEDLHVDALRVDAVSSMLYLDYSREPGHWRPNIYGGRENLEAIDFLKEATATAYKNNPGVMVIAEESTAWPGITAPTSAGGIGFGMKWNMGWMHDTLEYLHEEPINRKWHHNEITFSMVYAYSEHYVLPISHDEVVYGKGSLYGKMPGDDWQKLAGVRSMFAYQWAHPGKKLSFMGNELAQWGEWDHDASIDWDCLNWQEHRQVQTMVADLNAFYKAHPALWSQDFDPAGFQWLTSDDADHNTLSFLRIGTKGETLAVVVNFSGEAWSDYQVALPTGGKWTEVFTTDDAKYGGSDIHNGTFEAVEGEYHSRPFSAKITVPALGVVFLKPED